MCIRDRVGTYQQNGITPHIVYDGHAAPIYANDESEGLCITNNGTISFINVNADIAGIDPNVPFPNVETDLAPHNCTQTSLPQTVVEAPGL